MNYRESQPDLIELSKYFQKMYSYIDSERKKYINSKFYNYVFYGNKNIENKFNLLDSNDDIDVISLERFWKIEKGIKILCYPLDKIDDIKCYKDKYGLIRCFEKESLELMKKNNILYHPITKEQIPKIILEDFIITMNNKSYTELLQHIFYDFNSYSIFINYEFFLDLSVSELIYFYQILKDLFEKNIIEDKKIEINHVLKKSHITLYNWSLHDIRYYIINEINGLFDLELESDTKKMIRYIVLSSLTMVSKKIKKQYPVFLFDL